MNRFEQGKEMIKLVVKRINVMHMYYDETGGKIMVFLSVTRKQT